MLFSIDDAKFKLSELITAALSGNDVVIARDDRPPALCLRNRARSVSARWRTSLPRCRCYVRGWRAFQRSRAPGEGRVRLISAIASGSPTQRSRISSR